MKTVVVFGFAIFCVVQALIPGLLNILQPDGIIPDLITSVTSITPITLCLARQCGPKGGLFTVVCDTICSLSGGGKSTCTYHGNAASCACERKSLANSLLVPLVCEIACGTACAGCVKQGSGTSSSGCIAKNNGALCKCF